MPKKRDEGHEETEAVLRDLEKRISKEYSQAEKEIQSKLDDYMKRFKTKDSIKRQAVENGKITDADYRKWLTGQIAMGKRWEEMKDTIATDLTNASKIAKSITAEHMPDVYAINHNYGTFQVESDGKVDTSYTLYNRDTAERMFKETDFYKKPGKKIQKAINEGKQMAWDKKQIQSVMFQGIVQGESVGDIATRISKTTCDSDRKAAIRNARTITTGIENVGRTDAYKRAEDMGVDVKQQWLATLDFRTRHEHRELDGQVVALGEKFEVEGEQIEYPGDPSAADFLVYNCRCTLVPVVGGFERDNSIRHDSHLGDMSYEEWKESKEVYSDPITKQDDIAETMRNSYIQDYKYLAGQNPNIPNSEDYEPPKETEKEPTLPDKVRDGFDEFENKYGDAKTEHYVVYDRDGNVMYESTTKGKTSVGVPKYIDEQSEGCYSMHNHPADATFSAQDIRNYERYGSNGLVCDIMGNEYVLYNTNPSVDGLVKQARTEEEVERILPFSTEAQRVFEKIDDDVMTRRREYSKEVMANVSDRAERSRLLSEWMKENNPETEKVKWLEDNASKYGFVFEHKKYKGKKNGKG